MDLQYRLDHPDPQVSPDLKDGMDCPDPPDHRSFHVCLDPLDSEDYQDPKNHEAFETIMKVKKQLL
jgi:hypothetical protein